MTGVYAGSFDPPTLGHVDIIRQALGLFLKVHVMIAWNRGKGGRLISPQQSEALIMEAVPGCTASICPDEKYVASLVLEKFHDHGVLIRGLRDASDMVPEIAIRRANQVIAPSLQTIYFLASPGVAHISSSAVRALVGPEGWQDVVAQYVPPNVLDALR